MPELPSERVARVLRERIASGELQPGQRLPTTSQLAEELHCSRGSVVAGIRTLVSEGLVITRQRWGSWVAGGPGQDAP